MKTFTLEHKYCGMLLTLEGWNFWDVCKRNGLNPKVWELV